LVHPLYLCHTLTFCASNNPWLASSPGKTASLTSPLRFMSNLDHTWLLDCALTCFTERGLQATSTIYLVQATGLEKGPLYRIIHSKAALLDAVYAYALGLLLAPLARNGPPASKYESLRDQLRRWWLQLAATALAEPRAFTYWCLYRSSIYTPAPEQPVLGPFAQLPEHLRRARAPRTWESLASRAVSPELLAASLAGQWTAAVELVRSEASCQASEALRTRLLTHACESWWESLQVPSTAPTLTDPAAWAPPPILL
jgi:AcrR family transcriptional regulator